MGIGASLLTAALLASAGPKASEPAPGEAESFPIVELRQYALHDGKRDELIDLFEREFIESQEALGMKVMGTFTDVDLPNRFVWLRGFKDMPSRQTGLTQFYGGPVWQAHREQANATMIDSDNVLLLQAPDREAQFTLPVTRPGVGEKTPSGLVVATIYFLSVPPAEANARFAKQVKSGLMSAGIHPLGWFITEAATNNFPRLPVREGERVLAWFAAFADEADLQAHRRGFEQATAEMGPALAREPEVLRLKPTARSLIRGGAAAAAVGD